MSKKTSTASSKQLKKSLKSYVQKEKSLFSITIEDNLITFSGSQSIVDSILDQDLKQLSVAELCENILKGKTIETSFVSRNPYIFPPFPKKFNGKGWTIGSSLEIYCLEKKCVGPTIHQIYLYR